MARRPGSRNADYEQTRQALVAKLAVALTEPHGAVESFRGLAAKADVSTATLRHYFASREAIIEGVLQYQRGQGAPYLVDAATRPIADVRESLAWLLGSVVMGWQFGAGKPHVLGLSAGLGDAALGPAYVNSVLEPTLQAAEARIARHIADGQLERCNVRYAALELLSPVVLGLLHQRDLGGAGCRPLDLDDFLSDHLDRFLCAHAPRS